MGKGSVRAGVGVLVMVWEWVKGGHSLGGVDWKSTELGWALELGAVSIYGPWGPLFT